MAPKRDRKSTRLNSSHEWISYAVFCLKKKKKLIYIVEYIIKKTITKLEIYLSHNDNSNIKIITLNISINIIFTNIISIFFFFFNDTATTEIYTLSLHDALPI